MSRWATTFQTRCAHFISVIAGDFGEEYCTDITLPLHGIASMAIDVDGRNKACFIFAGRWYNSA